MLKIRQPDPVIEKASKFEALGPPDLRYFGPSRYREEVEIHLATDPAPEHENKYCSWTG